MKHNNTIPDEHALPDDKQLPDGVDYNNAQSQSELIPDDYHDAYTVDSYIMYDRGDNKPSRITKHIWLGDSSAGRDIDFLMLYDIAGVFVCAMEERLITKSDLYGVDSDDEDVPENQRELHQQRLKEYKKHCAYINSMSNYKVSLDDCEEEIYRFLEKIPEVTLRMHKLVTEGKNVYVHCAAGINRSPVIVGAYLILYQNMSAEDAIDLIQRRRHPTFVAPYTKKILRMLYADMKAYTC